MLHLHDENLIQERLVQLHQVFLNVVQQWIHSLWQRKKSKHILIFTQRRVIQTNGVRVAVVLHDLGQERSNFW